MGNLDMLPSNQSPQAMLTEIYGDGNPELVLKKIESASKEGNRSFYTALGELNDDEIRSFAQYIENSENKEAFRAPYASIIYAKNDSFVREAKGHVVDSIASVIRKFPKTLEIKEIGGKTINITEEKELALRVNEAEAFGVNMQNFDKWRGERVSA